MDSNAGQLRGQFENGVILHLVLLCSWEIASPPHQFWHILTLPSSFINFPATKKFFHLCAPLLWVCFSLWLPQSRITLNLLFLALA